MHTHMTVASRKMFMKILCSTYILYILSFVILVINHLLPNEETDFSRWLPCACENQLTITTKDSKLEVYKINENDLSNIIDRFFCEENSPKPDDVDIASSFLNAEISESYKSIFPFDLRDQKNDILLCNCIVHIYKMIDDSIYIYYTNNEKLDITEPWQIDVIEPISRSQQLFSMFITYVTVYALLFQLLIPPLFLLIKGRRRLKNCAVAFAFIYVPQLIYSLYISCWKGIDWAYIILLLFINSILFLLATSCLWVSKKIVKMWRNH